MGKNHSVCHAQHLAKTLITFETSKPDAQARKKLKQILLAPPMCRGLYVMRD